MILHCGLLLMFTSCVRTTEYLYDNGMDNVDAELEQRYSYWPSIHNGMVKLQKREAGPEVPGMVEGGGSVSVENSQSSPSNPSNPNNANNPGNATHPSNVNNPSIANSRNNANSPSNPNSPSNTNSPSNANNPSNGNNPSNANSPSIANSPSNPSNMSNQISQNDLSNPNNPNHLSSNATTPPVSAQSNVNAGKTTQSLHNVEPNSLTEPSKSGNLTTVEPIMMKNRTLIVQKQLDLHNPGVMMRGVIVFGGFLLLAVAYYIFYRKKGNNNDMTNSHSINDANQFRYGVLQSDDRRDNLELSRVPLTMDSDDDDDEDLEIFDLGQKKKSLSYVNLQTNDEDVVFPTSRERGTDKDNLLLDIEDASTDTLINWSSNDNNKSIL